MGMRITAAQREAIAQLGAQYGRPDRIMLYEYEPGQVFVWLRWHYASISSKFTDRNLFIKPDGERMIWRLYL